MENESKATSQEVVYVVREIEQDNFSFLIYILAFIAGLYIGSRLFFEEK